MIRKSHCAARNSTSCASMSLSLTAEESGIAKMERWILVVV
jgi:hypothetical protein